MALRTVNRRFKSTSDILDEVVGDKMTGGVQAGQGSRFRTYTFKDLQQERRQFVKKREQKKSQNLLKRLLASLDGKNEACEADDEFFTEYYRRNNYSNPNTDHSEVTLPAFQETYKSCRFLDTRSDRCRPDLVSKRHSANVVDYVEDGTLLCDDLKIVKNSVDYANSRRFRKNSNDLNRRTLERIFTNGKDEQSIESKNAKAKPNQRRSFKEILGSVIRWRRPGAKEKPRRFVSCDHLVDQANTFYSENVMQLPRISSMNAVLLEECEGATIMQNGKQNAKIRHIRDEKTDERLLEVLAKNKENRQIFPRNRSLENFVKPSAIKDITKHRSQLPESWQSNGRITARWK